MTTKVEATIEDLYKVEGKAELVSGEIVQMSPTGGLPNYAALEITLSLRVHANGCVRVDPDHLKRFAPGLAETRATGLATEQRHCDWALICLRNSFRYGSDRAGL